MTPKLSSSPRSLEGGGFDLLRLILDGQCHAAAVVSSFEASVELVRRDRFGKCGDERVVDLADEFSVAAKAAVSWLIGG